MSLPQATWGHGKWIAYIRGDMKQSVKSDIRPLIKTKGAFGVPRQFFPYIEYLSGLVFGPLPSGDKLAGTKHADNFLRQYMGRVDSLYNTHARILLEMWRHGVVHTYQPKVLSNGTRRLGWLSYQGKRTNAVVELLIKRKKTKMTVSHLTPHVGTGTLDHFPVANNWLVRDLVRVLDIVVNDLRAEEAAGGTALLTRMQKAAQYLAKPVTDSKNPFTW
jgi:hypothetical protein